MKISLNGRFLTAPQSGVQRVAANLTLELDRLLSQGRGDGDKSYEILIPRGDGVQLALSTIEAKMGSRLSGQAWEQLELPLAKGGGALVNLCNAGPLMVKSALTMIHDAQVFLSPGSYSKAFVAWYRIALPRLAQQSRYVLTVSEFSKAMLVRYKVAPEQKILVVPNGVDHILSTPSDPEILTRLSLDPGAYVFAFGNLQRHKNLDLLIRAFRNPRLKGVKLVVVGALSWTEIGAQFSLEPQPNVLLAGRLSDNEVRGLLENAACLALPSSTEGFGLPPLEAMILGCPAVVAPEGALPEVCGEAAIYAPLEDEGAWVSAFISMIEDQGAREVRRQAGLRQAARYSWERSATLFCEALEKAVG